VRQRRPEAYLSALWLAYFVGVTMLTHGESRYRHFFLFLLIPYAGVGLMTILQRLSSPKPLLARRQSSLVGRQPEGSQAALPRTTTSVRKFPANNWWAVLAICPALLVGYTFLRAYPYDYARNGAARSIHRMLGDWALGRGDLPAAEIAYRNALLAEPTPDGWLAMARLHAARGEREAQADALRAARSLALSYPLPHALLGDLLRSEGRAAEARQAFVGRYTAEQDMLRWSWKYLSPAPLARIEVGDGLDFGYLAGFGNAEELAGAKARWSGARSHLRLPGTARLIRLRVAAPWPNGQTGTAQLCAEGQCQPLILDREWRIVTLLLPPATGQLREIELRSPGALAPDGRVVGVLVDWYEGRE
jgi:hypothetical protein